jgi:hypothetical protein
MKVTANEKGLSVEVDLPKPPPGDEERYTSAWALLGCGVIGAIGAVLIAPAVGVIAAGVGVAAVGARIIVNEASLGDTTKEEKSVALPAHDDPDKQPPSIAA